MMYWERTDGTSKGEIGGGGGCHGKETASQHCTIFKAACVHRVDGGHLRLRERGHCGIAATYNI